VSGSSKIVRYWHLVGKTLENEGNSIDMSIAVMLFRFEKFDSESKIHIEKLAVYGYNSIEKFS